MTLAPPPAVGQTVRGSVVLAGWGEPVPGAEVVLLDAAGAPVDTAIAAAGGRFVFNGVAPGSYRLRAYLGARATPEAEAVTVPDTGGVTGVRLTLPYPLFDRAAVCVASGDERSGAVAGEVYEPETGIVVPNARVTVQWAEEDGSRGERSTIADQAGRFVVCDVPAETSLRAWASGLGTISGGDFSFSVSTRSVARLDLALDLGRLPAVRIIGSDGHGASELVVTGRVLDATTGGPIPAAEVLFPEVELRAVTDPGGAFRIEDVPPGANTIEVRRLGYALAPQTLEFPAVASVEIELHVSPEALTLEPLVVRTRSSMEGQRALASSVAERVVAGDRLRDAEVRGSTVPEVLRTMPSVTVNYGTVETQAGVERGACVESRRSMPRLTNPERRRPDLPWCDAITVVLDGVVIGRPVEFLGTVRLYPHGLPRGKPVLRRRTHAGSVLSRACKCPVDVRSEAAPNHRPQFGIGGVAGGAAVIG